MPGLIDLHVHARGYEESHKETWDTMAMAALHGGVTTVCAMPNTKPPFIQAGQIDDRQRHIGNSQIDYRLWFGATPTNLHEIERASNVPDVICGVKVYRGSSTGDLLVEDDEAFEKICRTCAKLGLIVAVHAENEAMMKRNRATFLKPRVSDHCLIRDTEVEVTAVARALEIQAATQCEMYFCHISTPEAVDLIVVARGQGARVYIEVCPHHLVFNNTKLRTPDGARSKMNPPLRSDQQVIRLRQHVFLGHVDTICSDHAPHTLEEKNNRNYDDIPSGVPGVEYIFSIMFNFVRLGNITLKQLIQLTAARAAHIVGFHAKGRIESGCSADCILVNDLKLAKVVDSEVRTKCGWTPYDGLILPAQPVLVISQGNIVVNHLR
ncbi:dihydroorotase family protein [Candidatus Berkelbacteria bacterium]|nr:dihydroorotase family protein [Candidatus Berkelbacteria bacterium]